MPVEFQLAKHETPPNGYRYTQSETGATFSEYDYRSLCKKVESHRKANGIPMSPEWFDELDDELCKQNKWPVEWCTRWENKGKRKSAFSFGVAITFLNFLYNWIKGGGGYVTQDEAEARAKVCVGCEFNKPVTSGCGACMGALLTAIGKIRGGRTTKLDKQLGQCGICSCMNAVSVHIPIEPQFKALTKTTQDRFQEISYCWKKTP